MPPIAGIIPGQVKYDEPSKAEQILKFIFGFSKLAQGFQRDKYERGLLDATMKGDGRQGAMDYITETEAGAPKDLIGSLLNRVNPMGTYQGSMAEMGPMSRLVMSELAGQKLRDPLEADLIKARTKDYESPYGRMPGWMSGMSEEDIKKYQQQQISPEVKPLSILDMQRHAEAMETHIANAEDKDWGGFDFTRDALKKAWENYKLQAGFDRLPKEQQGRLVQQWNAMIEGKHRKSAGFERGREYDWDPAEMQQMPITPETGGKMETMPITPGMPRGRMMPVGSGDEAPVPELERVWARMGDELKADVIAALEKGVKIERILATDEVRALVEAL